jgi:hypothetical protein
VRLLNLFRSTAKELSAPHIAVGSSVASALTMLNSCADQVFPLEGDERGYSASSNSWDLIIYAAADEVDAVWYDDESGRGFAQSKLSKIHQYLARYGALQDWELRIDNGWMRYWFNASAGVAMVYGVHKDVIRFNRYEGE